MSFEIVNPEALGAPKGFNHGMLAPEGGRILFIAGQTGRPALPAHPALPGQPGQPGQQTLADLGLAAQWDRALARVLEVVRLAGGRAEHIGRMTVYVTDREAYLAERSALAEVWRKRMGRHYPAVALVQVTGLVDDGAVVEIEATAVIP